MCLPDKAVANPASKMGMACTAEDERVEQKRWIECW